MTWDIFEDELRIALDETFGTDEEPVVIPGDFLDLSNLIADLYYQVSISAVEGTVTTRALRPIATNMFLLLKPGLAAAIFMSLNSMYAANIRPSTVLMAPIGGATVALWATAMIPGSIYPLPPPPLYAALRIPLPGSLLLFPGIPTPVSNGFKNAFTNNSTSTNASHAIMAQEIRDGFEGHMDSLAGIYIGMVPVGGFPTPIPTPWIGLTPE